MISSAEISSRRAIREVLEFLVSQAILAPSGDNTQPWRFIIDEANCRIRVEVDPIRDSSPMNAGQTMARIAVGAAIENIVRTARLNRWPVKNVSQIDENDGVWLELELPHQNISIAKDDAIARRDTNRKLYDRQPIRPETIEALERETPQFDGVCTHWIFDRDRIERAASLIAEGDAALFANHPMRKAFLDNVHFDAPHDAQVEEGLSTASLELSALDIRGLKMVRRVPNWLAALLRVGRMFATRTKALVQSSSGLCLVTSKGDSPQTDIDVGRAVQRAWLALTNSTLAAQPMMSIPVLHNSVAQPAPASGPKLNEDFVRGLDDGIGRIVAEPSARRVRFILRVGAAASPSGRTGRRLPPQMFAEK